MQTRVWIAVILNSSDTNGPLSNGRIPLMYSLDVYIKSFGGQKGASSEPPRTPLPSVYGPVTHGVIVSQATPYKGCGLQD